MKPDIHPFSICGALVALTVLLSLLPANGFAETPPHPGPFEQGKVRVGFFGGAGYNYGQTYLILGGGGGYFLADGLEIGFDFEGWLLEEPTMWKLSPHIRYVVWQLEPVRPYLGAFWRQTYTGAPYDDDDYSSYGGRVGVAYRSGKNYLAVGIVYEKFNNCLSGDCDSTYPEFGFWLSF